MSEAVYYFLQQLLNGLTIGSTYALIAIGYTMVYGIIGMINFAHGEVYMIGSYVGFLVIAALMMLGLDQLPVLIMAAFAISIVITSTFGWSIERVAYRPLRGGNRLIPLISAIGMSIFLQNYVRLAQGSRDLAMPSLISGGWQFGPADGFTASLSWMQMIIFAVTLICMLGLTTFISRSRMGRACRACSEDLGRANLLGIDTNRSGARRDRQHPRCHAWRIIARSLRSDDRRLPELGIQGCGGLYLIDLGVAVYAHRHFG